MFNLMHQLLNTVVQAIYFFLPAYIANTLPGIFGGGTPLDFGKTLKDGKRLLGNGVTIRGFIVGIAGGTAAGAMMGRVLEGFLLSFGALIGDAVGSFIKRRLGIERGAPAPLLDQLNFVVGGLAVVSLVEKVPPSYILVLLLITPFGHLSVNRIGYKLKLKKVPW